MISNSAEMLKRLEEEALKNGWRLVIVKDRLVLKLNHCLECERETSRLNEMGRCTQCQKKLEENKEKMKKAKEQLKNLL